MEIGSDDSHDLQARPTRAIVLWTRATVPLTGSILYVCKGVHRVEVVMVSLNSQEIEVQMWDSINRRWSRVVYMCSIFRKRVIDAKLCLSSST